MISRIQQLIHKKGLSPAQFADQIQVKRANLSHIMTGRNKPSLDFILKILSSYPDVNSDWLLFGKGNMHTTSMLQNNQLQIENIQEGHQSNNDTLNTDENEKTAKKPKASDEVKRKHGKEKADLKKHNPSQIRKIVVFFEDQTFREYHASE